MTDAHRGYARTVQSEVYRAGVSGTKPAVPVDGEALERAARKATSAEAFAYLAGGAGAEATMAANRAAFARWQVWPRVLRDVAERDLSIELLGRRRATPFLLSPIGVAELAHADADVAVGRAASALDVPYVLSNQASRPMEEVAAAMGGGSRWFQLYWSASHELNASLLRRAAAAGCEAVVVTLDTHVLGWRSRDLDAAFLPFTRGQGIAQYTSDPVFAGLVRDRRRAGRWRRRAAEGHPHAARLGAAHRPVRRRHAARRGRRARRAALAAPEGGRRDVPRRVLRPEPHVGRPRPDPRVDRPARAAQGHPASG